MGVLGDVGLQSPKAKKIRAALSLLLEVVEVMQKIITKPTIK